MPQKKIPFITHSQPLFIPDYPTVMELENYDYEKKKFYSVFICGGTRYNFIYLASGDIRTWKSYSGARRFLTKYLSLDYYV